MTTRNLSRAERTRFDELVAEAIECLPEVIASRMDEIPVIVLDRPTPEMLKDLGLGSDAGDELCGLHSGYMDTEASVEHHGVPTSEVHLFRAGIIALAGGWDGPDGEDAVYEEIMVTLLHEYGHQLGLDEDDLETLGYA